MTLRTLFSLLFLSLVLSACGTSAENDNAEKVPWASASFVAPLATEITFTNAGSNTRNLDLDLHRYHIDLDGVVPDSLAPGESYTVTVDVHRPRYLFYRSGRHESLRLFLPGRPRILVHGDSTITETGPFAAEYAYLDRVLMPINPVGRRPPVVDDIAQFQKEHYQSSLTHLDTISKPDGLPAYVDPLIKRTLEVDSYSEAFGTRFYLRFFYKDTLDIAMEMRDSLRTILARPRYYHTPQYSRAFEGLSVYEGEPLNDPALSVSTNNRRSITYGYLSSFPVADRFEDAVATRLVEDIANPRVYLGKMENIDTLKGALSAEYLAVIDKTERSAIERSAAPNGMAELVAARLSLPDGTVAAASSLSEKPLRLYKFWFAGCYPCLVQQPYEEKLLSAHPDVELIYVVHSTAKKTWLSYLDEHQPPAGHQLFTGRSELDLVKAAAGTTGAPTYVMTDADGKVICRPCPKPNDPLLETMMEESR